MPRVLQTSRIGVLSPTFAKLNGMPGEPDAPPTVAVTRYDGTALTAPTVTPEDDLDGRYYAVLLPGLHTNELDRLKLEWSATMNGETTLATQYVHVVSDMLVKPAQLYGEADMNSKPPWLLTAVCDAVNDYCESYCNKAFGTRVEVENVLRGNVNQGRYPLRWGYVQSLLLGMSDDLVITDQLTLSGSVVDAGWSWPWDTVALTYLHGQVDFSQKLAWEALQAARQDVLSRSARTPRQAISETTAGTVVRYSTPDLLHARPTGYLTLDPVLEQEHLPIGIA